MASPGPSYGMLGREDGDGRAGPGDRAALLHSRRSCGSSFSCCPCPRPPISGDRGPFVQAPPQPPFGLASVFSGRDIEDDLASENVRSWWKETCWR